MCPPCALRNTTPRSWVDVVVSSIYNLEVSYGRLFFHHKNEICDYIDLNWTVLCGKRKRTPTWWKTVLATITTRSELFQSEGWGSGNWALTVRTGVITTPPPDTFNVVEGNEEESEKSDDEEDGEEEGDDEEEVDEDGDSEGDESREDESSENKDMEEAAPAKPSPRASPRKRATPDKSSSLSRRHNSPKVPKSPKLPKSPKSPVNTTKSPLSPRITRSATSPAKTVIRTPIKKTKKVKPGRRSARLKIKPKARVQVQVDRHIIYYNKSCHQCKAIQPILILCDNYKNPGGSCSLKYCSHCLARIYGEDINKIEKSTTAWECLYCREMCTCPSPHCKKKLSSPPKLLLKKGNKKVKLKHVKPIKLTPIAIEKKKDKTSGKRRTSDFDIFKVIYNGKPENNNITTIIPKEIETPGWRIMSESECSVTGESESKLRNGKTRKGDIDEDITDKAFLERHTRTANSIREALFPGKDYKHTRV